MLTSSAPSVANQNHLCIWVTQLSWLTQQMNRANRWRATQTLMICLVSSVAAGQVRTEFQLIPNPAPAASSLSMSLSAPLLPPVTDTSSLSGTVVVQQRGDEARIEDLAIVVDETVMFRLLGITAEATGQQLTVELLEADSGGRLSPDGTFDQLNSLFGFSGTVIVSNSDEPWDLAELEPVRADLIGVRLFTDDAGAQHLEFPFEMAFTEDIDVLFGTVPLTMRVEGGVLAMEAAWDVVGDFDQNGTLDVADVTMLQAAVRAGNSRYDLNQDGEMSLEDVGVWVRELRQTWFGDANLDGEFNSTDLVAVFRAGVYEHDLAGSALWSSGDWNGDTRFSSGDLLLAFQDGGYERGGRAAIVPEVGWNRHLWGLLFLSSPWLRRRSAWLTRYPVSRRKIKLS